MGSDEKIRLFFYTEEKVKAGGLNVYFNSTPQYYIHHCLPYTNFTTSLPTETDKVWKITLSRVSGIRLVIHCNGVEVVDMVMSNSTCEFQDFWYKFWSRNMERIFFRVDDSASDFYSESNHRSPPIEGKIKSIYVRPMADQPRFSCPKLSIQLQVS